MHFKVTLSKTFENHDHNIILSTCKCRDFHNDPIQLHIALHTALQQLHLCYSNNYIAIAQLQLQSNNYIARVAQQQLHNCTAHCIAQCTRCWTTDLFYRL